MPNVHVANPRTYEAPEGRSVFVLGPFCWGKAKTGKIALMNCRANASRRYHDKKKDTYIFIDGPEEGYVDEWGVIVRPQSSAPSFEIGRIELAPPR